MKIEEWAKAYLEDQIALTDLLAVYQHEPAIFYQEAPTSVAADWDNGEEYPQLHYMVCKEERIEGYQEYILKFRILSEQGDSNIILLEQVLKECLENMVVQSESEAPKYLTWLKTKALKRREEERLDTGIIGMKVHFHMIEFPAQENMDPDPVRAMEKFIDLHIPQIMQIGSGFTDEVTQVSNDQPICYTRFSDLKIEEETNTVVWLEGTLSLHVLAVSQQARMKWMLLLLQQLSSNGEIQMSDASPMWIKDVQIDNHVDYKREGQISVTVRYGLPKYRSRKTAIEYVGITTRN